MKHIETYDFYKINESFDEQLLLENKDIKIYKSIQDKTLKKLSAGFYFAATYTWGVTMLYPIVDALIKNSNVPNITKEQVVLLTLFGITQILNMTNDDVKKIKYELETNNLLVVAEKVKKSLQSIFKIFQFVARSFGKVISEFIEMVAYVGLGVPFTSAIVEIVSKDGLNLDTLPQKVMVFAGGAAIYMLKSIGEVVLNIIKKY